MTLHARGCRAVLIFFALTCAGQEKSPPQFTPGAYVDFAMRREGVVARGREIFANEERALCTKCHTVDGSSSKAGPDLAFIGDKFPRRELIRSILEPSSTIAVGYGSTTIETKSDEEFTGIIKQKTDAWLELMGADAKLVRISTSEIKVQRGSTIFLIPEGLQAALSLQEFTDLVEYLVSLKEPESARTSNRGMPVEIPELSKPVVVRPFFSEDLQFPHSVIQKPGDVRTGLTWFGQAPGMTNAFLVVHQTGKIWLLEKHSAHDTKTLFADLSHEIFSERGPNGLLSLA